LCNAQERLKGDTPPYLRRFVFFWPWRDGKFIVWNCQTPLPDRCIRCGCDAKKSAVNHELVWYTGMDLIHETLFEAAMLTLSFFPSCPAEGRQGGGHRMEVAVPSAGSITIAE
jgi:hypothetical protein